VPKEKNVALVSMKGAGPSGWKAYLGFMASHWFKTIVVLMLVAVFLGGVLGSLYSMTIGRVVAMVRGSGSGGSSAAA
jgi:hypothetical protein